ncbi:ABC-ATPase domain-containing protein [Paenibacillus senegalensis]|uniref:ABC-ATPase domain-containing protein n=1 Tax=Paenibacillus senegalensis TaxID=1465766 RepID=UPI000289C57F|nr:ABC-ATPase domain-containing protein [Paenibacillus senegalensis]
MKTENRRQAQRDIRLLEKELLSIDRKGYKAYKAIAGSYTGDGFELFIDHVQSDPFASPSKIRVVWPSRKIALQQEWLAEAWRHTALEDFLARQVNASLRREGSTRASGSGKSGQIYLDAPGQEVLPRTAVRVTPEYIDVRLSAGLPADGRTVKGRQAIELLCSRIPQLVSRALSHFEEKELIRHLQIADQQQAIRDYLRTHHLVAFIANDSILPRQSGISSLPLQESTTVPFQSPDELERAIPVPHRQEPIRGMAIPEGITLIVGGGYHGKSTLLQAIERGVYNHVAGDGREFVLTENSAGKIRAEDGRSIQKVNISPFISNLPFGRSTTAFSSEDASGSTSQAANIMEALEAGSRLLLMDEDTSANNFMVRDRKMQQLVHKDKEPITPFVDRVRELYAEHGVSTIVVLGGSGDYFAVADRVLMMDNYRAVEVTEEAKRIAEAGEERQKEGGGRFGPLMERIPLPGSFSFERKGRDKVDAKGLKQVLAGNQSLDLNYLEQLVDPSQTRALAAMLKAVREHTDGKRTLARIIQLVFAQIEQDGLDGLGEYPGQHPGDLALPRRQELAAAINRLRSLKVRDSV